MEPIVKLILSIVIICGILIPVLYFTTPKIDPNLKHTLTIDAHGIKNYFLTIESKFSKESITIIEHNYSIVLDHGEYQLDACYYNVNNTMKCEGQRIWLDEDLTIDFFLELEE